MSWILILMAGYSNGPTIHEISHKFSSYEECKTAGDIWKNSSEFRHSNFVCIATEETK